MSLLQLLGGAIVISVLTCTPALAQTSQGDMQMTAAGRQQLIDSLSKEVENRYVFPDTAKQVAATLREQQGRGAYDSITSAQQLSEVLSQAMQTVGRDRHLRVMYSEAAIPERKLISEPSPEESKHRLAKYQSINFGVEKVERLPINIGYLDLHNFAPAKDAAATIAAAMTVLGHTDALIVDLRNNGGGDATTSTMLASYLLDKRTHLSDFFYRDGNRTEQRWSWDVVPGVRFGEKKDVYILTSSFSFSAAEDFAYVLKNLKRATVVGEATGGGANAGDTIRLLPNFSAFVPRSRIISPITRTNWEGVGVAPDISVCADDALRTAQLQILKKWLAADEHSPKARDIQSRMKELGQSKCS